MTVTAEIRIRPVDPQDAIDFSSLADLHAEAWRADYPGTVRFLYDDDYFRWLLAGNDWIGACAFDHELRLKGSVFSFFRTLVCGNERFAAGYSTSLAVAPDCRGAGLGRRLYDAMRHRLFEEKGRTVGVAMLQTGHGGMPTVASGVRRAEGMESLFFHQGKIWSKRLTGNVVDAVPRLQPSRVRAATTGVESSGAALPAEAIACLATTSSSIRFATTESFARMYMEPLCKRAGMLAYNIGTPDECAISFNIVATAIDNRTLGKIGQLQTVHAGRCTPSALNSAISHFCTLLQRHGCIAATVVDQGCVPLDVLRALGFGPSADELVFSLRGRPEVLQHFRDLGPPYVIDFI